MGTNRKLLGIHFKQYSYKMKTLVHFEDKSFITRDLGISGIKTNSLSSNDLRKLADALDRTGYKSISFVNATYDKRILIELSYK